MTNEYIYALIDPFTDEIRYIGKTNQPAVRLRNHCNEKSKCHRTNWIRSVVAKGGRPRMVLLMKVPSWSTWQACERMWIDHALRSYWPITNSTFGGDGMTALGQDVRDKIGNALRGRKLSPKDRERAIATLAKYKGHKHTPESRNKLRIAHTGKAVSAETRRRISQSKMKLNADQVKEVRALHGVVSLAEIGRRMGVSAATIDAIVKGKRKYSQEAQ